MNKRGKGGAGHRLDKKGRSSIKRGVEGGGGSPCRMSILRNGNVAVTAGSAAGSGGSYRSDTSTSSSVCAS